MLLLAVSYRDVEVFFSVWVLVSCLRPDSICQKLVRICIITVGSQSASFAVPSAVIFSHTSVTLNPVYVNALVLNSICMRKLL